jgi:adenylate kinase family enzyme
MPKPVVFLVGLHGSGKTTLGRLLKDRHGWRQLSVGDLGRLARRGKLPSDVSLRLMLSLAHSKPGHHIAAHTASLLLAQGDAWRRDAPVVIDGFPSLPAHVGILPERSGIVHVQCAEDLREPRLLLRGEKTQRKWTPNLQSERDLALGALIASAARHRNFITLDNSDSLDGLERSAAHLHAWSNVLV